MTAITMDEIRRDLMGYLQRVKAGETLVILEANEPVAEIKPVNEARLRPYALCAGEFQVLENLEAPLPDEIIERILRENLEVLRNEWDAFCSGYTRTG